jgi:serpin B
LTNDAYLEVDIQTGKVLLPLESAEHVDTAIGSGYREALERPALPDAVTGMASAFFQEFAKNSQERNSLFSSYVSAKSLVTLSAMTQDRTREEINLALGIRGERVRDEATHSLRSLRESGNTPGLVTASALWFTRDSQLRSTFKSSAQEQNLLLYPFDPSKSTVLPRTISAWLKDKMRPADVHTDDADLPTGLWTVLVDAISFGASWNKPMDGPGKTPFRFDDGRVERVKSVSGDQNIRRLKARNGVRAASLSFDRERFDIVFLLPEGDKANLADVQALMEDRYRLERFLAELDLQPKAQCNVTIPTLRLRQRTDLRKAYARIGVNLLFDPAKVSFAGAFDHLDATSNLKFVAKQSLSFDLDEYGVFAAAVQTNTVSSLGIGESFRINRPFCFLVRDRCQGCCLFVGCIKDPRQP